MTKLPDRWEDEPWPLDDPVPTRGLSPVNWSDTHDNPPQVADLADEAWEYAIDHGVSMEVALARLQDRAMFRNDVDRQMLYGNGSGATPNGCPRPEGPDRRRRHPRRTQSRPVPTPNARPVELHEGRRPVTPGASRNPVELHRAQARKAAA